MYCFVIFQKGLRSVFDESSQTAWFFFCTTSNIYRYIPTNSHKTLKKHIQKFSGWITLSIGENRIKLRTVVFEFIADRQTDRRGIGLRFILCINRCILIIFFACIGCTDFNWMYNDFSVSLQDSWKWL